MEKLTIEEKAKAYDKAIKVIKDNLDALNEISETSTNVVNIQSIKNCFYKAFPELKESEDDRIRKALIDYFDDANKADENPLQSYGIHTDKAIAWLEKQCKQKPTDKVKPKFKVGDWVIDKQGIVHQITNVIENVTHHTHGYDIVGGGYFNDNTEGVRLWTIQDAKDGDVLVSQYNKPFIYNGNRDSCSIGAYCGISMDNKFKVATGKYTWTENVNIQPATEEQRCILMKAIYNADYEWDAKKKELKPTK